MMNSTSDRQKKIAVVGDLTGYGRCALTVSLPLLSAHGFQACPVPTAVLSNHTGFPSFFMKDFTDYLPEYFTEWERLHLSFDGFLTGFLGSVQQVDFVIDMLQRFRTASSLVVVDPVMGDNGTAYQTITQTHCREMKKLSVLADILTPNLTEACLLAGVRYRDRFSRKELLQIAEELITKPGQRLVITGLEEKGRIGSFYAVRNSDTSLKFGMFTNPKIAGMRCGTGDVFSSLITADALLEKDFPASVRQSGRFVCKCLAAAAARGIEEQNGVCFEDFLRLKR